MKIIVAPDSYKESASVAEVASAMAAGILRALPDAEVLEIPVADGGEGSIAVLHAAGIGVMREVEVLQGNGLLGVSRYLLVDQRTAIIEIAEACGLAAITKHNRNPFVTTSYGVGELIMDALKRGVQELVICLGGSSTNDGGLGMLQALGVKIENASGRALGLGNQSLSRLHRVDVTQMLPFFSGLKITLVSDVDNPLLGEKGATYTYASQKGAYFEDLATMEVNLTKFADVMETATGRHVRDKIGSGAAGGIGFALQLLSDEIIQISGIDYILEQIDFANKIKGADLVLTGEGATDFQTAYGKAPIGVAKHAHLQNIPTIIISGAVTGDLQLLYDVGVNSVHSVLHTVCTLEEALLGAKENITYVTEAVIRTRFL